MIKSSKSGFTLAEVLTTLMVIGVVAAMTIPTLMNSTGEQQARVACKKAASVLSQGVQLLVAKEVECDPATYGDDADDAAKGAAADEALMACMGNVLSGTQNATNHTITTPDGMVYQFFAPGTFTDIETSCGASFLGSKGAGNCAVVVDTNGFGKGTKGATGEDGKANGKITSATFNTDGFGKDPQAGTDVVAFALSSAGAKPIAISGSSNKTYEYMFGKTAGADAFSDRVCCDNTKKCPAGTKHADAYYSCTASTGAKCANGYTEANASAAINGVAACDEE